MDSPRSQGRDTLRKRIIRAILSERGSILLDELRWLTLRREAKAAGKNLEVVTDSQVTSFARTVRDYMPEFRMWDLALSDDQAPLDLIATTAVFRLRERSKLDTFLQGSSPTVVCRFVTDLPIYEFGESPRYRNSNFVTPYYHLHLVDLYAAQWSTWLERIKIPPSHKLTIVGTRTNWELDQVLSSKTWIAIQG